MRLVDKSGCLQLGGNAYPVAEHLVGKKVTVRFDPFDLSRIRLYENGEFTRSLEPQTLVNRTFRKAMPRRKDKGIQLESSTSYRKQVSRDYKDRVQKTLASVQGQSDNPLLSQLDFIVELRQGLENRELTPAESSLAQAFFRSNAPLSTMLVRNALQKAVEAKGAQRHLRFYLDAVRVARQEGKAS